MDAGNSKNFDELPKELLPKSSNTLFKIIVIVGFVIILCLLAVFIVLSLKQHVSKQIPLPETTSIQKGDINHDGSIDYIDQKYVRDNLNCSSTRACWNNEIAKTSDGDNPIYVYDLDTNGDNVIDNADIPTAL
jgi:hypothetical protein